MVLLVLAVLAPDYRGGRDFLTYQRSSSGERGGGAAEPREMAQFVIRPVKPGCRSHRFEAAHQPIPVLDTAVVLLEMIVQVRVRPMPDGRVEPGADRTRVGILAVGRDPVGDTAGDGYGRAEERLGRGAIARFAQPHVDQIASAGAIQVTPAAADLDVRLVDVSASIRPIGDIGRAMEKAKCLIPFANPFYIDNLWRRANGTPGFEPGNGGIKIRCLTPVELQTMTTAPAQRGTGRRGSR
jgi:hypothetical protein